MPYASLADVQELVSLVQFGSASRPSDTQVVAWLAQTSNWIDGTLRWKYQPGGTDAPVVTDAADLAIVQQACALIVAARVWQVVAGTDPAYANRPSDLRKDAFTLLAYTAAGPNAGRSMVMLPNTVLSETGEASLGQPATTLTDPSLCGNAPRLFSIGMEL